MRRLARLFAAALLLAGILPAASACAPSSAFLVPRDSGEVYGSFDEATGAWKLAPLDLPQAINETDMLKERIALRKGYYRATLTAAAGSVAEDGVVGMLFGISEAGRPLACAELFNRDFGEKDVFRTFSVCFALGAGAEVEVRVLTTDRNTFYLKDVSVLPVGKEEYEEELRARKERDFSLLAAKERPVYDENVLYLFRTKETAYSLSSTEAGYDAALLVSALQGLVNRDGVHLFTDWDGHDSTWLGWLRENSALLKGRETVEVSSLEELLLLFGDFFEGYCLWDRGVPATSNVACTAAGALSLLPLRAGGELHEFLAARGDFRVLLDLTGKFTGEGTIYGTALPSTGSKKCDAYLYAKETFLDAGLTAPALMAFHPDAFYHEKSGTFPVYYALGECQLPNKDYYIAKKAFFFDLNCTSVVPPNDDPGQTLGCDEATLRLLLKAQNTRADGEITVIGGFVPWYLKYTSKAGYGDEGQPEPETAEWSYARLFGEYYAIMDADAYGQTGLSNASVYTQIPKELDLSASVPPSDEELHARCVEKGLIGPDGEVAKDNYVLLYMGDYDSSAWIMKSMPAVMNDEALGFVPMSFPVNASIYDRAGFIYDYMYGHFNENVSFIADHNGYGYLDVASLKSAESGINGSVEAYLAEAEAFNRKFGLRAQGFLIDTFGTTSDDFGRWEELIGRYSESFPGGVSVNTQAQMRFEGGCFAVRTEAGYVPWTRVASFANASGEAEQVNVLLGRFTAVRGVSFTTLRTVVCMPTHLKKVFETAWERGAHFTVLPADEYYYLAKYFSVKNGNIYRP